MWKWLERVIGSKPAQPDPGAPMVVHEAFGGAIRVFGAPVGSRWQSQERQREGNGFLSSTLLYLLPAQPAPMVLMAKVYTLTDGERPARPDETDWTDALGSLFEHVEAVDVQEAEQVHMRGVLPAVQGTLRGSAPDGWPLMIRERRAVFGPKQLIVSVMGPEPVVCSESDNVDSWFSETAFDLVS